jgi:hypothetical protein
VVEVDRSVAEDDWDEVVPPDPFGVLPHPDPSRATTTSIIPAVQTAGARRDQLKGIFRPYFNNSTLQSRLSPKRLLRWSAG